jgi:hypothetical protein
MKIALMAALAALAFPAAASARPGDIWQIESSPEYVVLHYGIPPSRGEQDMPGIMCHPRSAYEAVLFTDRHHYPVRQLRQDVWVNRAGRQAPWPMNMTVRSGAAMQTFAAHGEMETDDELVMITATIPNSSPIVTTFQRTGDLRLSAVGEAPSMPRAPLRLVRQFFTACAALNH